MDISCTSYMCEPPAESETSEEEYKGRGKTQKVPAAAASCAAIERNKERAGVKAKLGTGAG